MLKEAKVKEINDIREKEKIAAQLKEANHRQLLELQSNKKEKLDNLHTKVNDECMINAKMCVMVFLESEHIIIPDLTPACTYILSTYIYAYTSTHTSLYVCAAWDYTHIHTHTHTYAHTPTRTHMHSTHTHTHTYIIDIIHANMD